MNITKETAILAKEVGFDEPCWNFIDFDGEEESVIGWIGDTFEEKFEHAQEFVNYFLPTKSELQQWIWENHTLWVQSTPIFNSNKMLWINVTISSWKLPETITVNYTGYDVYEGLEMGLQEALILIKEIKNEK